MTMHIDLTVNGTTLLRIAVHPQAKVRRNLRSYYWQTEPVLGEEPVGGSFSLPTDDPVEVAGSVLRAYHDRKAAVPCPT